jgi:hypothetical protein
MSKVRDDVRTAFDKEQSALGDVGDARQRLVRAALTADAPPSRGLQWAAAIAAVLIAAIIIATFALVRANGRQHAVPVATPSPRAQASPTPLNRTLAAPDATPIITFGDPAQPAQTDGITWDGKVSGVLAYQPNGVGNPANNLFANLTEIHDRSGRVVGSGTFGAKYFTGTWADDNAHLCQMVPFATVGANGVATTLQLVSADGKARNVARVGVLHEQTFVRVTACSVLNDRAVVAQTGGQGMGTLQYWVVQLSTGKIIWTRSYDVAAKTVELVVSRDGMYVAENLDNGGPAGSTVYGPDGSQVARLSTWVEAFSWDGSLAVTDNGFGTARVNVVSWRDGMVIWSAPAGYGLQEAKPQPGGSELALWLLPLDQFAKQSPIGDLYVVSASGQVVVHIANTP